MLTKYYTTDYYVFCVFFVGFVLSLASLGALNEYPPRLSFDLRAQRLARPEAPQCSTCPAQSHKLSQQGSDISLAHRLHDRRLNESFKDGGHCFLM